MLFYRMPPKRLLVAIFGSTVTSRDPQRNRRRDRRFLTPGVETAGSFCTNNLSKMETDKTSLSGSSLIIFQAKCIKSTLSEIYNLSHPLFTLKFGFTSPIALLPFFRALYLSFFVCYLRD